MDKGKAKKYLTTISATLGIIAVALLVAVALAKYVIKDEKNINSIFTFISGWVSKQHV